MFIAVPYKSAEELIYLNLDNVVMAMPRIGRVGPPGERKGKTYTSFLMTGQIGSSPTLDTLLEWSKFIDEVAPFESVWSPGP